MNAANCRMGEVRGRDMEPTLWDGSSIVVDLSRNKAVDGRVFMLKPHPSDPPIVRRFRRRAEGWRMYADNPVFPSERLLPDGRSSIIGQVLWSAREHCDDDGPVRSALADESALREGLAMVVSLLRGLTRRERDFLLEAARKLPTDDLLRVGLDASHAVLASVGKEEA